MSHASTQRSLQDSARRAGVFVGIAAVHVLVVAVLVTVRQQTLHAAPGAPIEVAFLPGDPRPEPARPLLPFVRATYPVEVVLPLVDIAVPTTENTAISAPREPPAAAKQAPVELPLQVESVDYVTPPAPRYPLGARRARVQGVVLLRVLIDAAGRPAQVLVHKSSGNLELDEAARKAVLAAIFRPYQVNGVARSAMVIIPIEFSLRASATRAS